jgi:hypothetical protein
MGQQLQPWGSADAERMWLSMLVDAMEQASRPEIRAIACESSILIALRAQPARPAQSARPASSYLHYGSEFRLRS